MCEYPGGLPVHAQAFVTCATRVKAQRFPFFRAADVVEHNGVRAGRRGDDEAVDLAGVIDGQLPSVERRVDHGDLDPELLHAVMEELTPRSSTDQSNPQHQASVCVFSAGRLAHATQRGER